MKLDQQPLFHLWSSKNINTITADGKTRLRGGHHLGLGLSVSVLELAGEHLGSVEGWAMVHRRVGRLRGPQGLGDSLLGDL